MLPYFSFIVKYFSGSNSGVMPDYFYHDINKIEVTLMSLYVFPLEIMWDVVQAEKNYIKNRLYTPISQSLYLKYEFLTALRQI